MVAGLPGAFQAPFGTAYEHVARERNLARIEELFLRADADGSGGITIEEFHAALHDKEFSGAFAALGVQPHQATRVFEVFDTNRDRNMTREEFMNGLHHLVGDSMDIEGTGKDLDIHSLDPSQLEKRMGHAHVVMSVKDTYGCLSPDEEAQMAFVQRACRQALQPAGQHSSVVRRQKAPPRFMSLRNRPSMTGLSFSGSAPQLRVQAW